MEVYTGEGSLGESSSSLGSGLASPWILNDLEQDTSIHRKDEGLLICKIRDGKRLSGCLKMEDRINQVIPQN